MSPTVAFLTGVLILYVVASGKSNALWSALTGVQIGNPTQTPGIQPGAPINDPFKPPVPPSFIKPFPT